MGGKLRHYLTRSKLLLGAICALIFGLLIYQVEATIGKRVKGKSIKGLVTDTQLRPVVGATVYFIDASTINTTKITAADIQAGTSDAYDEPLEDIVNNAEKAKALPQGKTDKKGKFSVKGVNAEANYFVYVVPGEDSADYMPGGDKTRNALSLKAFPKGGLHVKLSWKIPADASYIGTTACFACHDKPNFKKHAHQLGLQAPGARTVNQDISAHPDADYFVNVFKEATAYTDTGVKKIYFEDYDATRSSDKFKTYEDKTGGGKVYFIAYLWKQSGQYKVTLLNQLNAADPKSPWTLPVKLTYGGMVYKQRLLLEVTGRKGLYPFLQAQLFNGSLGRDSQYDRGRKAYRDYKCSVFWKSGTDTVYGTADDVFGLPSTTSDTLQNQCAECHFTGYRAWKDEASGEVMSDGVDDINGAFDADADGKPDEINIGCEACHGPGSKHREEAMKTAAAGSTTTTRKNAPVVSNKGKHILHPGLLSAERSAMICGRCHDRSLGLSALGIKEGTINAANQFAMPGISRAEALASYLSQKTYSAAELWEDGIHPKQHRSQYLTWLASPHARNSRQLVSCDTCHDLHGDSSNKWFLKGDPDDSLTGLCSNCHAVDVVEHVTEKTGAAMTGAGMNCADCHMSKPVQSGAGSPGMILGTPTGASSDANIIYWQGDVGSHLMDVPTKFSRGVAGKTAGSAMPIPYTNSCAQSCHDASKLPYQAPNQ